MGRRVMNKRQSGGADETHRVGCIAIVLLAGALVACVVGGIFMLGLSGVAEKAETEGVEFGKRTDQRGCEDEALRRLRAALRNRDLLKRRQVQLFVFGCFQSCQATPDFCPVAPKEEAFLSVRQWAQQQCRKEGLGDNDACENVFMEVSDACLGKTKRK